MSGFDEETSVDSLLTRALFLLCLLPMLTFAQAIRAPQIDIDYRAYIRQDFEQFNPRYERLLAERTQRAFALGKQILDEERQGSDVACAHQIILEIEWLLGYTADFARIDRRLDDLERVLTQPDKESLARRQDPVDGSWGHCYTEWFFKLDATYDYTQEQKPMYPLRFLDRVNSPDKLRNYYASIEVSDIAQNGIDHRRELNESLADLVRLILHDQPKGYVWAPGMKSAIMQIVLNQVRNPSTGWWGERYKHNAEVYFVDDLSITFHMLSYLNGNVPDLAKVVDTALALKDLNYPQGWLEDGGYSNHNNMDAVVLFHYGWNSATPGQRKTMTEEIDKMLSWCLSESLQPDGTFRTTARDDSLEESEYFGTAFLARIGFFDKPRRFWTDQEFPEAQRIRQRIRAYITKHAATGAAGGVYYQHALGQLDAGKSQQP